MVDKAHLDALRDKYGNAAGGDIFEPHFQEVARSQFSGGDKRKWPFAGIPTFLDARGFPEAQDADDFGGLDIALLGVPMDLGVTNRNGTRFGPRALRTIERIGPYDHVLRTSPMGKAKIADIGDVPLLSRFDLARQPPCEHHCRRGQTLGQAVRSYADPHRRWRERLGQ